MAEKTCTCPGTDPRCADCIREDTGCTAEDAVEVAEIIKDLPAISAGTVLSALLGKEGMLILGYNPDADPIPLFNPDGARCWMGPGCASCDDSGKWGPRFGDPDNPRHNYCPVRFNRKHHCSLDTDPPAPPQPETQQPLFGVSHG
jgi:hypothetical protein